MVPTFGKAPVNTELVNPEPPIRGKIRAKILPTSGHSILLNQPMHNLILGVFLFKDTMNNIQASKQTNT